MGRLLDMASGAAQPRAQKTPLRMRDLLDTNEQEWLEEQETRQAYADELKKRLPPVLSDAVVGIDQGRRGLASLGARVLGMHGTADRLNRDTDSIEGAASMNGGDGLFRSGVRSAANSITTAAAMAPLGSWGIIGGFAASEANQAITTAQELGLEGSKKWAYVGRAAAIEGGVAGAFQLAGLGGFEKMMGKGLTRPGLRAFLKETLKSMAEELPEENITEIMHAYNNIVSGVDPTEMTAAKAVEILKRTTVSTLLTVGITSGYQGATSQKALRSRANMVAGMKDQYGFTEEQADGVYERAAESGGDFAANLGREIAEEHMLSSGLEKWAKENPKEAHALARIDAPSRRDFEDVGLPRRPKSVRKQVADMLREIIAVYDQLGTGGQEEQQDEQDVQGEYAEPPDTTAPENLPPPPEVPGGEGTKAPEAKPVEPKDVPPGPPPTPTGKTAKPKDDFVRLRPVAPEVQDPANMVSKTGRKLSPYPDKAITSKATATRGVIEADEWMIREAIAEAEANGDDFAATLFKSEAIVGKHGLPQASRDMAHEYIFGRENIRLERPPAKPPQAPATPPAEPPKEPSFDEKDAQITRDVKRLALKAATPAHVEANRIAGPPPADGAPLEQVREWRKKWLDVATAKPAEKPKDVPEAASGKKTVETPPADPPATEKPKIGRKGAAKKDADPPADQKPAPTPEPPAAGSDEKNKGRKPESTPPASEDKPALPPPAPKDQRPAPEPPKTPEPPQAPQDGQQDGSTSKWLKNVSAEKQARAEELKKKIREKLNRVSAGVDPTLMVDGIELTAIYVDGGVRNFAEYAKEALSAFGPQAKGYLLAWWQGTAEQSEFGKEMEDVTRKQANEIIEKLKAGDSEAKANDDKPETFESRARAIIEGDEDAGAKNRAMKKLADDFGITEKEAQERVESVLVDVSREVVNSTLDERGKFDKLLALYRKQPRFSKRTSTSIENQAYSTPVPLAYAAALMAGVTVDTSLYEPTGGMGALTITADPGKTTVNEIDALRRGELAKKGFRKVTGEDAVTRNELDEHARVMTNPPFGPLPVSRNIDGFIISKKEHLIAIRALEAMADDGRAAIIVGASLEKGKLSGADRVFLNYLLSRYNVVGNYEVSGDLYGAQGASFPVRLVVVAGRHDSTGVQDLAPDSVQRLETWDEVWSKVQEVRDATEAVGKGVGTPGDGEYLDGDSSGEGGAKDTGGSSGTPGDDGRKTGRRGGSRSGTGGRSDSGKSAGGSTGTGGGGNTNIHGQDSSKTTAEGTGGGGNAAPGVAGKDQGSGKDSAAADERPGSDSNDGRPGSGNVGGKQVLIPEGEPANDRQNFYRSASKAPGLKTLVNRMLSPGTSLALSNLASKVGDIDAWVAKKLGYASVEEMHKGLAAEQVDGVALAIDRIENGSALIIGDQTGVGKGRQAAAIMRYAQQQGYMPVFVTADPKLFSDMHGDMHDIGGTVNPLLLGEPDACSIKDRYGNVVKKADSVKKQSAIMQADVDGTSIRDAGYDAVFVTYTQLQTLEKDINPNPRHRFLDNLSVKDKMLLVLDEAHEGAGSESITGIYLRGGMVVKEVNGVNIPVVRPGLLRASGIKGVAYLSATYAKRPESMPLFFKTGLGRAVRNSDALIEAFKKGGVALQQWAANALAAAGDYIRREQDFDGVRFDTTTAALDPEHAKQTVESIDRVAEVLRAILEFSRLARDAISQTGDASTADTEEQLRVAEFSSSIRNYVSQVLLALKVDATVAHALASHKKGEATVIAVSNTMESFLKEYIEENSLAPGDGVSLSFGDVLKRALDRTMRASRKDAGGVREILTYTAEDLGIEEQYNDTLALIDELGEMGKALPVSPIDAIHSQLRRAGLKTGELTGRSYILDYQEDGSAILRDRPRDEAKDKNVTVNRFNSGALDTVILNAAGSTGLSLHASKKNPEAGQRPRHMIIAQPDLDINIVMQTLGRILRTGLAGPAPKMARYTMLASPVEAERRPMAILRKKMASLNANTTADTDSTVAVDSLDFFNKYGDQVVSEMLHDDIDMATELGVSIGSKADGSPKTQSKVAQTVAGRIAIMSNVQQAAFYTAVIERYEELVRDLKESGEYDIEMDVQESWKALKVSETVLEHGGDNSSPFTSDVKLAIYSIIDPRKPMSADELRAALVRRWGTDDPKEVSRKFRAEADAAMQAMQAAEADYVGEEPQPSGEAGEDEAMYRRMHSIWEGRKQRVEDGRKNLRTALDRIAAMAGATGDISVTVDAESGKEPVSVFYSGTLLDVKIRPPRPGANPYRLASMKATFAVEHPRRTVPVPFSQISTGRVTVSGYGDIYYPGFAGDYKEGERTNRYVYTGNLIRSLAITGGRGQITTFRTEDGQAVTGIVMSENWTQALATRDPRLEVSTGEAAASLLVDTWRGRVCGVENKNLPVLTFDLSSGTYRIVVPKAKSTGGKVHQDKGLRAIIGDFSSSGNAMRAETQNRATFVRAVDYLLDKLNIELRADGPSAAEVAKAHGRDPAADSIQNAPPRGRDSRPARGIGASRQDGSAIEPGKAPVQAADVTATIKRLWPGLSIHGPVTFRKQNPGWYDGMLGLIRLRDSGDVGTLLHELGHHFDRELGNWSKSRGLPSGVTGELLQLGRVAYGGRRPAGGYRAEGFAEFIRGYLSGEDTVAKAPDLHRWFTTEYLPAHPTEAKKLRSLEDVIARYQLQSAEQTVRAFRQPIRQDWSSQRIAAQLAARHIDVNLPVLRAMQATGADLSALAPEDDPFMLLTAYSRTAGGRVLHSVLGNTVDLAGNDTGMGLREALAPITALGKEQVENWTDYAIARRALDLHTRRINPGIAREDAQAVVDKYRSVAFDKALSDVTDWSRRTLGLLVEAGAMTQAEMDAIEAMNPVYVPFARQFAEGELRAGRKSAGGRGVYRIRGGGNEIHNPIDALILQAERITETAMRSDVLRAMVKFYDSQKGKAKALGLMLSELPAPTEATTFAAEQIKREMARKALQLGADPQAVAIAAMDEWTERITVFTKSAEFHGKENVVAVTVDGKRRFFQVNADLKAILDGLSSQGVLSGKVGEISRGFVGLQRLGATGLNPAFSLLRNPLRDMLTAFVTGEYHFHLPVISTLRGMLLDIANSEEAQRYHALGLDIGGRVGQDWNAAEQIGHRALSRKPYSYLPSGAWKKSKEVASRTVSGLREILSHSEVGPRLMEFQAAYEYGQKKWGSAKSAAILAACAAKDVTVNFSRAGSTGRKVNEVILFYNAGIQSADKLARAAGIAEAAPWAKTKSRGANAVNTLARGAGSLTVAAILNYLSHRDEDWWKKLPPYEKWGYIHISGLDGKLIARIPLPFEAGAVFGALPVAMLEEQRTPGAFKEALLVALDQASPLGLGGLHKLARNIAAVSPLADVLANEDWKGDDIVPANIERSRLRKDQYGPRTTWLAKQIGRLAPGGVSPAKVDHLLNGYTGGLYKRMAEALETAADPSGIGAGGDMSTLPVFGTLFLRPGTSRVIGDFYDRLEALRQTKGSGEATLAEIGELAEAERLSRSLQDTWAQHRQAVASKAKAGEIKTKTDALIAEIQDRISEYQQGPESRRLETGIAVTVYALTDPGATPAERAALAGELDGVSRDAAITALRNETKRRGGSVKHRESSGRLTAYGARVARLTRALEQDKAD